MNGSSEVNSRSNHVRGKLDNADDELVVNLYSCFENRGGIDAKASKCFDLIRLRLDLHLVV
jgi:hypothetical protein